MGDVRRVVDWYKSCIHDRQRRASTLTIEVGLDAQDREDPTALAETMQCLDTAIEILEEAKALGGVRGDIEDAGHVPDGVTEPEALMDDLGHSMTTPIDLSEPHLQPGSPDWHLLAWEDSLLFFL